LIDIRKTLLRLSFLVDKIPDDQIEILLKEIDFTLDEFNFLKSKVIDLANTNDSELFLSIELLNINTTLNNVKIVKNGVPIAWF
jgi:hypothetical protein